MQTDIDRWALAYLGYLSWLCAGLFDFICHRRTDLPHTSGVRESALHLIQLALIGTGVLLALYFEMGQATAATIALLVASHAVVGYLDTRSAFRVRTIAPGEQHLHSVLDMAPIIAFACLIAATWPAAITGGWEAPRRQPMLDATLWAAMLLPAALLCVVPALLEFRAAWSARRALAHDGG